MRRFDSILVHVALPTQRETGGLVRLLGLALLTAASAVVTKEMMYRSALPALAETETAVVVAASTDSFSPEAWEPIAERPTVDANQAATAPTEHAESKTSAWIPDPSRPWLSDPSVRYFNGRPIRPARTITMLVTAYSPDARSCDHWADGITASIHSVDTNAGKLVAADSRVLPLGSMISVPGYDEGRVVPVLDRGGAIKGNRLDVLFPTHEQARNWGVRRIRVVEWAYADDKPADDYRTIRGKRRWN